jgi:hypothetical protein
MNENDLNYLAGIVSAIQKRLALLAGLTSFGMANYLVGMNAAANALEYKQLLGTTNQITVTHAAGSITLAAPQDLHTGAGPTFDHVHLTSGIISTGSIKVTTDGVKFELYESDVPETDAYLKLLNSTTLPGVFGPIFYGKSNYSSIVGLYLVGDTTDDAGTAPIVLMSARQNNTTVATRPLFAIGNYATLRMEVLPLGEIQTLPSDRAASPVYCTGPLNFFGYNASKADDAIIYLPPVTTNGFGVVIASPSGATIAERTQFFVDNDGDVTLINNSTNVVANADTDTKLCIGTAAAQEPLQIKNRLGGTRILNIMFWYD